MEGELEPPYYTPIYKSLFNVVSNKDIQVIIEDITTVPLGGASIPIKVTL